MPLAGSGVLIEASTDDASYAEVDGIKTASFSPTRDLSDVTYFKTADVAKRKFALLRDGTISLAGNFEHDTNGQDRIRAKFDDGADCFIRIKFDPGAAGGSQGYKVATKVESYEISSSQDGVVEWTASLSFTGLPVAV
jgi:predicted secreted protein